MMLNQNESGFFPRFEDISKMSEDLIHCLPVHDRETWGRILYRLSFKAQTPWVARFIWASQALIDGLPYRIDREQWRDPVDWDEAYRMGFNAPLMSPHSAATLNVLITAMEVELGTDHVDIQPMHQYRRGLRDRITKLLEDAWNAAPDV